MHELSLAENVLRIVEDAARAEGASRVRKVVLAIGRLAAVEPEAMLFCFDAVTRDSIADGASLEIVETPGRGWCARCSAMVPMDHLLAVCPGCGIGALAVRGGTEMKVLSLEVE